MPSTEQPAPAKVLRSKAFVPALVAAVVVLVFLPSLWNGWTNWDDQKNFLDNRHYRGLGLEQLKWMWSSFVLGHYHPVTWMSLGLDYALWGMNPFGYHLTSVLLHAANSALLYLAILALMRFVTPAPARWPAMAGALLHALHPLRVESVAWITERRDVLCGFFALLAVLAYLKRVEEERAGRPSATWLALAVVAFGASLLSKALSITLPAVLLLLDVYPLGRFTPGARRRLLLEKVPFLVLCVADALAMRLAMQEIDAVRPLATYDVAGRAAQAAYGLCFYLAKTAWPSALLPLYRIDAPLNPWQAKYVLPMIGVAAATALLVARRRRWPAGLAAWTAYVVLVLPVLGVAVTGMQIAADRYTYLALIPLAALVAAGLDKLVRTQAPVLRLATTLSAAALVLFSVVTIRQIAVWKDAVTLWTHMIRYDQGSSLAFNNRGSARQDGGDSVGALEDCTRAIELDPSWADPFKNRGLARVSLRDFDGAIRDFTALIQHQPRRADSYRNRGVARLERGDLGGAVQDLTEGLRWPGDKEDIYVARGLALARKGDLAAAIGDFEAALKSAPGDWPRRPIVRGMLETARRKTGR